MRIGILGGTFDPPHIGHLVIAEQARDQLCLDVVIFVPAYLPPHKMKGASADAKQRLAMTRMATKNSPNFRVSPVELKRKGVSYTIDTINALREQYPSAKLFVIMGGDNFRQFDTWKSATHIRDMATIVVYERSGVRSKNEHIRQKHLIVLKGAVLDISSTIIRQRVHRGESIQYLVPSAVHSYIRANKLYQSPAR